MYNRLVLQLKGFSDNEEFSDSNLGDSSGVNTYLTK